MASEAAAEAGAVVWSDLILVLAASTCLGRLWKRRAQKSKIILPNFTRLHLQSASPRAAQVLARRNARND